MDEVPDCDALSPHEKRESPRGRELVAEAPHCARRQTRRFPEVRRAGRDCEDRRKILNGCFAQFTAPLRENARRWAQIDKPRALGARFRSRDGPDPED